MLVLAMVNRISPTASARSLPTPASVAVFNSSGIMMSIKQLEALAKVDQTCWCMIKCKRLNNQRGLYHILTLLSATVIEAKDRMISATCFIFFAPSSVAGLANWSRLTNHGTM